MRIGIIAAMEKEIKKYQEIYDLKKINEIFDIYEGKFQNKIILLCVCGIGKVNAAATTQHFIDQYQVDCIINSGCAGSLIESVKVLDTIIASYVTYHDFTPIRIMKECVPQHGKIQPDQKLTEMTINILKKQKTNYQLGGICSGDCFVTSSKKRDQIYQETSCLAVDMESASIGHIATKNKVPFIIIRSISDFADGVTEQEEKAANISAFIVQELVSNL